MIALETETGDVRPLDHFPKWKIVPGIAVVGRLKTGQKAERLLCYQRDESDGIYFIKREGQRIGMYYVEESEMIVDTEGNCDFSDDSGEALNMPFVSPGVAVYSISEGDIQDANDRRYYNKLNRALDLAGM